MNVNYLRNKIYPMNKDDEEALKIQPGEYISLEIMTMLRDASSVVRSECFATADAKNPYTVETICPECGKTLVISMSKSGILDYFSKTNPNKEQGSKLWRWGKYLCDTCKEKLQNEKKQQEDMVATNLQKEKDINTSKYIKEYLTPNTKWETDVARKRRIGIITDMHRVNEDEIVSYIKQMQYKDFLKTPYWNTISAYKKYRSSYKCSICGGINNLSTHHRTYERHGCEHHYDVINKDLIVLCQNCHSKFHDKLPTPS